MDNQEKKREAEKQATLDAQRNQTDLSRFLSGRNTDTIVKEAMERRLQQNASAGQTLQNTSNNAQNKQTIQNQNSKLLAYQDLYNEFIQLIEAGYSESSSDEET